MRLFKAPHRFVNWPISSLMLLVILTSCNPYARIGETPITSTVTISSTPTQKPKRITPTITPAPRACTVDTGIPRGQLNLRTGAGVQFAVIRILNEGEAVRVLERASWTEVIDRVGNHGFVYSKYCKIGGAK